MDFGIMTAKVDEIGYITRAENLGYTQGLRQIMLYPPLNRQYRVSEDFADKVIARL